MAKGKRAAHEPTKPPANEFFRGDEHGYNGGDKTINSTVGSCFAAVTKLGHNALDRGIAEQGGGANGDVGRGGRKGRK
jgi:hypothetical protein